MGQTVVLPPGPVRNVFLLVAWAGALFGQFGATVINPGGGAAGQGTEALVTSIVTAPNVNPDSVRLERLDDNNRVIAVLGALRDDGQQGDLTAGDGRYSLRLTMFDNQPGRWRFRTSAAIRGQVLRVFSPPFFFEFTGTTAIGVKITQPANLAFVNVAPVMIRGTSADVNATVNVNGLPAAVVQGQFNLQIPLIEGNNTVTAVAQNSNGTISQDTIQITLDTQPPRLNIDTPTAGQKTTESSIAVSGLVNDIVAGTVNDQQVSVTVNGVAAQVRNRTFLANVALAMGLNNIQVVARDRVGNQSTQSVQVTREAATRPVLRTVSGNLQSGRISTVLAQPLVVEAMNGATPLAGREVVFTVMKGGGAVNNQSAVAVMTNAQGRAQVSLRLGNRAGSGNNQVEASSAGLDGTPTFAASGTAGTPQSIVVDTGSNQQGVVNQALPLPFVVIVTDGGFNRLANVAVIFTVRAGGGVFQNGQSSIQALTDNDGRALAVLTLGPEAGNDNNRVEANFAGNPGLAAAFVASGRIPGNPADTSISGVVLDNSSRPIPNVTIRLFQTNLGNSNALPRQVGTPVRTDSKGVFNIPGAPVGYFKVMADGSTAGNYPTLEYDILTVAGIKNDLGTPIYLPLLNLANQLCVSPTTGGTLTLTDAPGFALTVAPGSATFPGGAKNGCLNVTVVNGDKIPMPPGFGQQPRFIVTIQPVGTLFSPPAKIQIPNVDGLPPNAVTEMYSFDHDLSAFVAIGTGTVSADGSVIVSDPGVGVIKAGWHCGGNPNSSGSAGTCPQCQTCQGNNCVTDNSKSCDDGQFCTSCQGGQSPGADCCQGGGCKGKKLADQDEISGSPQTWDFTALAAAIKGAAKSLKITPGCSWSEPNVTGAIKIGRTKSCCEKAKAIVGAGKFTGEIGFGGIGGSCNIPTPLSIPGLGGIFITVGLEFGGSAGASGYQYDNPQCGDCSWSVDGKLALTGKLAVQANVLDPDIISIEGGGKAEGSVAITCDCKGCPNGPVKGCLGPPTAYIEATLLFTKKNFEYTFQEYKVCTGD